MLNLLIISNNPKAKLIQNFVQPLIKARIDLVSDFDHGLKDVFEKRPATVIIQEQISGVAGESVARHIQLLLGSGAPSFIMLHEGNARIRPVKGLYDVIVDLDQPGEELVQGIVSALKRVIGDTWDKVAVPPPAAAPIRVVSSAKLPSEASLAADKLVEEFLPDVEPSAKPLPGRGDGPPAAAAAPKAAAADELATLLTNADPLHLRDADHLVPVEPLKPSGGAKRTTRERTPKKAKARTAELPDQNLEAAGIEAMPAATDAVMEEDGFDFPQLDNVAPPVPEIPARNVAAPAERPAPIESVRSASAAPVAASPSPADFRIIPSPAPSKEQLPEDILTAFDENYRSRSRMRILLFCAFLVAGGAAAGWYLFDVKPRSLLFWKSSTPSVSSVAPAAIAAAEVKPSSVAPVVQRQQTSAAQPVPAASPSLPSFIPAAGRDSGFSAGKPGWERYVDAAREVRVYRANGRIRAIQVMAAKGREITDAFMQAALGEVTGSSEYAVRSSEQKQGILIQRCTVGPRSDLLVYRKAQSGTISAFVVSLE